jgi:hypothetical protein
MTASGTIVAPTINNSSQAASGPTSTWGLTRDKTLVLPLPYGSFLGKPPLADSVLAYKRKRLASRQVRSTDRPIEEDKRSTWRRPDAFRRRRAHKDEQEECRRGPGGQSPTKPRLSKDSTSQLLSSTSTLIRDVGASPPSLDYL